jgi:dTDP-4-dehydrorhamnose 3,5-epimerase
MKVRNTKLAGVMLIEPDVYTDSRGFFFETYHGPKYEQYGLPTMYPQDNASYSKRGTLRGLHAQLQRPQGKLVRVVQGEVFDVAVDIRLGSPTFGQWVGYLLSSENFRQCFIPPGFAHGFCVLSPEALVEYKCTDVYNPGDELGLIWNDPDIGINWPIDRPLLSQKDSAALRLCNLMERLPHYRRAA